jgi:hypothetical protein
MHALPWDPASSRRGMAARLAANAWDAETAEWAGQVQIPRQPQKK